MVGTLTGSRRGMIPLATQSADNQYAPLERPSYLAKLSKRSIESSSSRSANLTF